MTDEWLATALKILVLVLLVSAGLFTAAHSGEVNSLQILLIAVAAVFFALGSGLLRRSR